MTRISEFLVGTVRDEVNHLFTERPFPTAYGLDTGWFCREHAVVVAALARMLGEQVELCMGNVILWVPSVVNFAMLESDQDHAWCRVEGIAPIDASATTIFFGSEVPAIALACPDVPGSLGEYELVYLNNATAQEFASAADADRPVLGYNERRVYGEDPARLLDRPFSFLHRPPPGSPNILQLYGQHVLFRIAAHLHKLGLGQTESISTLAQDCAIREICERESEGRVYVQDTIASQA